MDVELCNTRPYVAALKQPGPFSALLLSSLEKAIDNETYKIRLKMVRNHRRIVSDVRIKKGQRPVFRQCLRIARTGSSESSSSVIAFEAEVPSVFVL